MTNMTTKKPKKKQKPGPKEDRLIITRPPEEALRDLLKAPPDKKQKD